jgi:hypothetical protein
MATFEEMEKEQKIRDKFLKSLKISINEKKEIINFRQKTLGKHTFGFKARDVLFALLGMPMKEGEIDEIMDLTEEEREQAYVELLKGDLVENIATVKKKKLRGDKHMQVFWRLSERGEKLAMELLNYMNDLAAVDKKEYKPLTKNGL